MKTKVRGWLSGVLLLMTMTGGGVMAQGLEIGYRLSFPQPQTHLYEVRMTIGGVRTPTLELCLPTWTPGSYLQREYARHVQDFSAGGAKWEKTEKATWRVETGATAGTPRTVEISYRVYANELATQTSHLDGEHAYFNGATIFMYVPGAKDRPHRLKIEPPSGWQVSSPLGLAPGAPAAALAKGMLLPQPSNSP